MAGNRRARGGRHAPRLRMVFLAVSLVILLVPLGGTLVLRLYESALVRRAEAELFAQGAFVAAQFRAELERLLDAEQLGVEGYGSPRRAPERHLEEQRFRPFEARLDLAIDPVLPPPAPGRAPAAPADPVASAAGARLEAMLLEAQRTTLAGVRVLDPRGVVVATTGSERGLSLALREEVFGALQGSTLSLLRERVSDEPRPAYDSLSRTTRLRVFVALPVINGDRIWGAVVLSRTPMSVGQSLYGVRHALLSGLGGVLLLVVLVAAYTSRTVTRPVDELIRRTEQVALGDMRAARPLESPGTHEVGQLSEAFARMALALEQRGSYLAGLASNVSHELKTPLAALRGTVELLRDHLPEMTSDERERFLANLEQDVARLDGLVRGLLDLARADLTRPDASGAELGEVVARVAASLPREPAADLQIAAHPTPCRTQVTPSALEAIVRNLLDNALRHAGAGASVRVSFAPLAARGMEGVELVVSDDGGGISEANQARVFDAFFTTARERGGTGLGLAIVRSLVEAHRGTIELRSAPGATAFRVWLPRARDGGL